MRYLCKKIRTNIMNSIVISQDIYNEAENFAKSRNISLSALVEHYLQKLLKKHHVAITEKERLLSLIDKNMKFEDLQGIIDGDLMSHRDEALADKYGL